MSSKDRVKVLDIETRSAFSEYWSRISARESRRRADGHDNALRGEPTTTDAMQQESRLVTACLAWRAGMLASGAAPVADRRVAGRFAESRLAVAREGSRFLPQSCATSSLEDSVSLQYEFISVPVETTEGNPNHACQNDGFRISCPWFCAVRLRRFLRHRDASGFFTSDANGFFTSIVAGRRSKNDGRVGSDGREEHSEPRQRHAVLEYRQ